MEKITLKQLESDFDSIFDRVEKGESFHILTPDGKDVMMVPSEEVIKASIEAGIASPMDDDYFKLYQETAEAP
jgi:antitoxin (DNA-binding transcriptional repressor) of toxin-antitoxin stability system